MSELYGDKIAKMNEIIEENITSGLLGEGVSLSSVKLQYLDIRLDLYFSSNEIIISAFSRGHYVRENPAHRIMHRPSEQEEPASDKGDGSLFLALVVIYCNNIFSNIEVWIGGVTDWWRIKGVCAIKDACTKTERSGTAYEINNDDFLNWSKKILDASHIQDGEKLGGRKKRRKKTRRKRSNKKGRIKKKRKTKRKKTRKKSRKRN